MRKRILSFLLALSMVVSLLPAGAFAETSGSAPVQTRMFECQLEIGDNGLPMYGDHGTNWTYDSTNNILTLTGNPQITIDSSWDFSGKTLKCKVVVNSGVNISGGTFNESVENHGTIQGGTFGASIVVDNRATIEKGTFHGKVTNGTKGIIWNGTFNGLIENQGTIQGGTFSHPSGVNYYNYGTISGGTFEGGSYVCNYDNGVIAGGTFGASIVVDNRATIEKGTFHGKVANGYNGNSGNKGTIQGGTFYGEVTNNTGSTIEYGVFPAGLSSNSGTVNGGYFNGKNALPSDFHHVEVGNGKIVKMAGVETATGEWENLYVRTDAAVLLTADVDITDIEGEAVTDVMLSDGGKTVNFNMRNHDIVLNKTSAPAPAYRTELVMGTDGKPDTNNVRVENGVYVGDGWKYDGETLSLAYKAGGWNFSGNALKCKVEIGQSATIKGGTFEETVTNHGTINSGIFAAGLTADSTGNVYDGYFGGDTKPADGFYSISVTDGGKLLKIDDNDLTASVSGGWEKCWTRQDTAKVKASVGIATIDGEKVGEVYSSYYVSGSDKTTVVFWMPAKDVVLGKLHDAPLVMEDGYPDTDGADEENGVWYGDGWEYNKTTETLTLTGGTAYYNGRMTNYVGYYFNKKNPMSSIYKAPTGEDAVSAVKCKIVVKGTGKCVKLMDGTFEETVTLETPEGGNSVIDGGTYKRAVTVEDGAEIDGGTFKDAVENHGTIYGGIFAAGLSSNTGDVRGGYFGGDAKPANGFYSISVQGGKLLEIDGINLKASVSDGWDKCWTRQDTAKVKASVGIATINSEKIGEETTYRSSYPDENDKSTVTFTMPNEDVVLEKAYRTELVIKEDDGKPNTDGVKQVNGVYVGDGWKYDGTTLSLAYKEGGWDFSGNVLKCEVEVGQGATIKGGTFEKTVKNNGYIDGGTFNGAVINYGTINDGTFNDKGQVINDSDGVINGGTFEGEVVNYGTIKDGTYNGSVENNGKIVSGTFKANVVNGANGVIYNAIFTETSIIYNSGTISGQRAEYYGDLNNLPGGTITGGIFAAGLSSNTGTVNGGYFATGANLPDDFYSISVQGGKLLEIDDVSLTASVSGGWEKCWTRRTGVKITANVDITNINGEKIGEETTYDSSYVNGDKKTVEFTKTSGEDVVLNKNRTDGVLVMDPATGLPKVDDMEPETDGTYTTYKGNGWEYDADNKVLTLHGTYTGNVSYAYYDFTSTKPTHNLNEKGDGLVPQVNCEIVAEGGVQSSAGEPYSSYIVILNGGTFKEKVTLKGATSSDPSSAQSIISAGTFENEVEVCPGAAINGGTYTENSVINNKGFITMSVGSVSGTLNNLDGGEITNGKFNISIDNRSGGTITGGVFYAPIENNGTITGGIFFHALSGDVRGGILLLSAEETPAGTHRVTMDGDAKFVRVFSGIEEYPSGTAVAYLVNADKLDGKNVYAYKGTQLGVVLDQEITNLNGKAVGTIYESCYPWEKYPEGSVIEDKKGVCFTMPGEDVVLNKAAEPAPKPDEPGKDDPKAAEYTIKVDEYAKVNGKSSVTVKTGDTVSLTVSETPDGQTFDHWDLPSELQEELTKQDSTFNNSVKDLSFRMPDMGDTDAAFSIKTGFRSAELPADDSAPSALGTAAIVAVGGATAGILVWQGVSLGVDSYLQLSLPDGVAIPTNRRELVTLLWETAGKPEVALPALYNDVPAEDLALQKASRWAEEAGLVKAADDKDASRFDPDHYVTKMDVFGAWLKLQKLLKNK